MTVCEFSKVSSLICLSYHQPTGAARPPMVNRFYLVREHRLHGIVTGLEAVRTIHSLDDKLDRLLVSFKDAKVRGSVASLFSPFLTLRVDCAPRMVRFHP